MLAKSPGQPAGALYSLPHGPAQPSLAKVKVPFSLRPKPNRRAEGRFVAAPPAMIVGAGLEAIETGFEAQRKGVSAQKVVVALNV